MRGVGIDECAADGRVVESSNRNCLESFVCPVDVVAYPVNCNSFTILNVCKGNKRQSAWWSAAICSKVVTFEEK